jgi:peptidoglycan hydrolase-like protein with peptidoglycan-binding domain
LFQCYFFPKVGSDVRSCYSLKNSFMEVSSANGRKKAFPVNARSQPDRGLCSRKHDARSTHLSDHAPVVRQTLSVLNRSGHLRGNFGPGNVLYLQQAVGNHAVQRLLITRQKNVIFKAPDTVAGPLTRAQVHSAIAYYAAKPTRYTREIIMEIQMAVGTTPTGRMSAVDVQAVAKRQQDLNVDAEPKLKIDGKAGPRTLPSIFKFGLAEDDSISDYTKKAREVWDKKDGKSEEVKAEAIVNDLVNKRLEALKIPRVGFQIVSIGTRGAFSPGDWKLKLDPLQFQPGKFHDPRDTTATIYHEARHAEQDFRIGQLLARQGKLAEEINAKTGLNLKVAEKAVAAKDDMTPMQALIAQGWFDSLHSEAGRERHRRNSDELKSSFKAREAACEVFKKSPTPENKIKLEKAKARFSKAVAEHDDMPHEFDPERLEAKVEKLFGKGEEHNDPCR